MKMWRALFASALPLSLFIAPISPALAAVSTGVGVTSSGLVLYYDPANPNAYNSGKLRDLSGNGNDATINKTGSWPGEQTTQGKYLGFDGLGGYIDVDSTMSGVSWPGLTITFYANFGGGTGSFERIIDFGNGSQSNNIEVGRRASDNILFAEVWNNSASQGHCLSTTGAIGSSTWDFWAVTFDGTNCKIYKNNSLNATTAYTYLPLTVGRTNAYIGKSNWADAAFEGGISDLAIYNKVLNSTELTQNYNASTDITAPTIGNNMRTMAENNTAIGTVTASESVTFEEIAGYDSSRLSITSSGVFTIDSAPSYESPQGYYANNQYGMYVRMTDLNGNYADGWVQVTVTDVNENSTLTVPTLSASPYKGVAVTITVTPGGDTPVPAGKITYLIANKRIKGCYKKTYSGSGNSTCTWKPASMGYEEITVTFTPTNTSYVPSTSKKSFWILKRTNKR